MFHAITTNRHLTPCAKRLMHAHCHKVLRHKAGIGIHLLALFELAGLEAARKLGACSRQTVVLAAADLHMVPLRYVYPHNRCRHALGAIANRTRTGAVAPDREVDHRARRGCRRCRLQVFLSLVPDGAVIRRLVRRAVDV